MLKISTLVIAAIALAGCQTPAGFSWEATEDAQCVESGFEPGTELYLQCRQMLASERMANNRNMSAAGNAWLRSEQQRRQVNCHTVYTGNIATTQCN